MGEIIKGVLYLIFSGFLFLQLMPVFGFGKDVNIDVLSNANISNAKIIELKVENTSSKWLDYSFFLGSDLNINTRDFSLKDNKGNVLKPDGRSDDSIRDLRKGEGRILQLVFVDRGNEIDNFSEFEYYASRDKIEISKNLPEAQIIQTDEDLLHDVLFGRGDKKDKAMEELKNRIEESLNFSK